MNPHQRCLQAKVKYRNEPKQVMPKSEDLSRSLEINAIWTFDTEFPTIFNKSCTYITLKSAVKHKFLKNQHALAKRNSQLRKNGQDVNIQIRSGARCSR